MFATHGSRVKVEDGTDLFRLLNFYNPDKFGVSCTGFAPTQGRRCRNPIAARNLAEAELRCSHLHQLPNKESELRAELQIIAGLMLCRRYHQDQATGKASEWVRILRTEPAFDGFAPARPGCYNARTEDELDDEEEALVKRLLEINRRRRERSDNARFGFYSGVGVSGRVLGNRLLECRMSDAAEQEARERESREHEMREQEAREQEARAREAREREARDREEREREARRRAAEEREARERELRRRAVEECAAREREQREREDREEAARQAAEDERREEARRQAARERAQQQEDARRREAQAEQRRAREAAQAEARRAREEAARLRREAERRAWDDVWTQYERAWSKFSLIDTASLDEGVLETLPWPTRTQCWRNLDAAMVREFFRQGPSDSLREDGVEWRRLLRRQSLRWHPDKIMQKFPKAAEDEEVMELVKAVMQSTYKNQEAQVTEERTEEHIAVQEGEGRLRERQSSSSNVGLPRDRKDERYTREEVRITEDDRYRPARVRREEDIRVYEDDRRKNTAVVNEGYREPYQRYAGAQLDVEDRVYDREHQYNTRHTPATQVDYNGRLDNFEQDYRQRTTPYPEQYTAAAGWQDKSTSPRDRPEQTGFAEREPVTLDPRSPDFKSKRDMGYYDEDGHYHSFRHGLHRAADRILHPIHGGDHHHHHESHHHSHSHSDRLDDDRVVSDRDVQVSAPRETVSMAPRYSSRAGVPNTITIPCHHIRIGDLLILQGRPCQVIRITTSAQTGQHRYLGVDLFTKQLHEESSFVSNPSPSVIVQNMLGPVFKQYRVLDIRDDGRVVAMTETGDVKQGLPVLDQSSLLARLNDSFNDGRGSVRVLVISDEGREMAVDYKVVHGSRL